MRKFVEGRVILDVTLPCSSRFVIGSEGTVGSKAGYLPTWRSSMPGSKAAVASDNDKYSS